MRLCILHGDSTWAYDENMIPEDAVLSSTAETASYMERERSIVFIQPELLPCAKHEDHDVEDGQR